MARIKEIWCMHHSHLDVGYTHPQPMLMELQGDYLEQAVELCEQTRDWPEESRFRWVCESWYPVEKWLKHAESGMVERFKGLVAENRISITALPMHTTPCATEVQLTASMRHLAGLKERLGTDITTAVTHDVNGQPWPLAQILLDSHVDFYMTGINMHFGGIPFKRPMAFRWQTPDGRELLSYVGEHYSLFSQFFHTELADTGILHREIDAYARRLERQVHGWDVALLTATNPPLYDNNCPDAGLADLIRRYNEEGHEYRIRFATPEMFRDKLLSMGLENFPVYGGDWTDYWNFGCASAPRESWVGKTAARALETAGMLECMNRERGRRYRAIRREADENALVYTEHTWECAQSVADPDDFESVSQYVHKQGYAFRAADLAGYLVGNQVEKFLGNPFQSDELSGVAVFNPAGVSQKIRMEIPEAWLQKGRQLSPRRAKEYIPYFDGGTKKAYFYSWPKKDCGEVELPPYGYQIIPLRELADYAYDEREMEKFDIEKDRLETPYYRISLNPVTGRILQLYDKIRCRNLLDESSEWSFFELVRETADPRYHEETRRTLHPREVDRTNRSISLWNHDWKARRTGADRVLGWSIRTETNRAILTWRIGMAGIKTVEQQAVFYSDRSHIDLNLNMHKTPVYEPESLYLAFPLKMDEGWKACYSTAGQIVEVDDEQLGDVCRDYLCIDNGVAVYNEQICFGLACPHAPMVQIGDFNFGKEQHTLPRKENPLLLAWPVNNYWDTNFIAAPEGPVQLSWRFFIGGTVTRTELAGEFIRAENRGLVGAVVRGEKRSGTAVEASEEGVISAMYPAEKEGMILLLHNQETAEKPFSFRLPWAKEIRAWMADCLEEKAGELTGKNGTMELVLKPGEMARILVIEDK